MQGVTWLANLLAVGVLPLWLGLSDASAMLFLSYCLLFGTILTFAEDDRFLRMIAERPDVRAYLVVRIVMTLALGAVPFLIGKALA